MCLDDKISVARVYLTLHALKALRDIRLEGIHGIYLSIVVGPFLMLTLPV